MHLRFALRKEEWEALKSERDSERLEREKAGTRAAGLLFFQRLGIRRTEWKRLEELRRAKAAEIEELRRKEREEETNLGPGEPQENPGRNK
jgi:hypothetical protein